MAAIDLNDRLAVILPYLRASRRVLGCASTSLKAARCGRSGPRGAGRVLPATASCPRPWPSGAAGQGASALYACDLAPMMLAEWMPRRGRSRSRRAAGARERRVEIAEGVLWLRCRCRWRPGSRQCLRARRRRRLDGRRHRARHGRPAARSGQVLLERAAGRAGRCARVIVTHHHPDHVGLAGWFQSARGPSSGRPAPPGSTRGCCASTRRTGRRRRRWRSGGRREWIPRYSPSARRRGRSTSPTGWPTMPLGFRRIAQGEIVQRPAGGAGGSRPVMATRPSRRRSGAWTTRSCSPATRSCRGSRPTSGSTPPSPRPIRWATGWRRAGGCGAVAGPGSWPCPAIGAPSAACRPGCAELIAHTEAALERLAAFLRRAEARRGLLRAALRLRSRAAAPTGWRWSRRSAISITCAPAAASPARRARWGHGSGAPARIWRLTAPGPSG